MRPIQGPKVRMRSSGQCTPNKNKNCGQPIRGNRDPGPDSGSKSVTTDFKYGRPCNFGYYRLGTYCAPQPNCMSSTTYSRDAAGIYLTDSNGAFACRAASACRAPKPSPSMAELEVRLPVVANFMAGCDQ